jgi:3alpha(or 20beta)-hydroxysteroid dehydrogenase
MGRLEGKVALITGSARGQGAAEARRFAEEGARVIVSDVLEEEGRAVAESLSGSGIFCRHDVRSEESWDEVVAAGRAAFGKIDVLLNNAGILHFASLMDTSLEKYMQIVETNQVGCFIGMKAVVPEMKAAGGGSIVNVSSVAGMHGTPHIIAYTASKFAVRGMTKVAAIELGRFGIRVNSIHPGGIATPMVGVDPDDPREREAGGMFDHLPIGRIGSPEEVANLVLFLASDESSYCTGSEFIADGGLLAGVGATPRPRSR